MTGPLPLPFRPGRETLAGMKGLGFLPARSSFSTRKRDREDVKDKDDMECDARTEHRTGFRHRDLI